jgi:hypothetical protein
LYARMGDVAAYAAIVLTLAALVTMRPKKGVSRPRFPG